MRRALFVALTLLMIAACIEAGAFVAFFAIRDGGFDREALGDARARAASAHRKGALPTPTLEVVHPYLGFVYDPGRNDPARTRHHGGVPISEFGFLDDASPLREADDETIVLGVFGGSFAYFFSVHGLPALLEGLRTDPELAGKRFSVVRVALGGYKQPQPLLALSYLLALGAHFDWVVEIDGFNEVALPARENVPQGVFPFFPRNWSGRVARLPGHDARVAMLRIADLREARRRWARAFGRAPLAWSVAANAVWWARDRRLAARMSGAQARLAEVSGGDDRYEVVGPPRAWASDAELYEDLAAVWSDASLAMHRLATASGIEYWHFLQPNQHVPGSKPMGRAESDVARQSGYYAESVAHGYPILQRRGRDLAEAGVRFHDLTLLFRDEPAALYADDCCHLNERGYEIVGRAIASRMLRERGRPPRPAPSAAARRSPAPAPSLRHAGGSDTPPTTRRSTGGPTP